MPKLARLLVVLLLVGAPFLPLPGVFVPVVEAASWDTTPVYITAYGHATNCYFNGNQGPAAFNAISFATNLATYQSYGIDIYKGSLNDACGVSFGFAERVNVTQWDWSGTKSPSNGAPGVGMFNNYGSGSLCSNNNIASCIGVHSIGSHTTNGFAVWVNGSTTAAGSIHINSNSVAIYGDLAATPTPTASNTPTNTPTPTATFTPSNTPTNTPTATRTPTGTIIPLTPGCSSGPVRTATPTRTPPGAATATRTPTGMPTWTPTAVGTAVGSILPPADRFTFDGGAPYGWDFTRHSGWSQEFGRGGANGAVWIGSNPEHTPYTIGVDHGEIFMPYLHSADWVMTGYYYVEGVPASTRFYFDAASYGLWSFDNFTGWAVMWNPYLLEVGRDGGAWLPFTLANPHGPDSYELLRGDLMKLYLYIGGSFVPGVQETEQFRIWFDDIQFKLAADANQCPTKTPTPTPTRTPTPAAGTYTPGPTATRTPSRTSIVVTLVTPQTATATATGTLPATGTPSGSLTPRPTGTPGGTPTSIFGVGTPWATVVADFPCNDLICVEVTETDEGIDNPCLGYDSFALGWEDFYVGDQLAHGNAVYIPGVKVCFILWEIGEMRVGPWDLDWVLVLVLTGVPALAVVNMIRESRK